MATDDAALTNLLNQAYADFEQRVLIEHNHYDCHFGQHARPCYEEAFRTGWLAGGERLTATEHRLAVLEPCYADAQSTAARLLIEREQYDQTVRNAEERAQFAVERADAAERERDKLIAAWEALVEDCARAVAAAEQRATRLEALEVAARGTHPLSYGSDASGAVPCFDRFDYEAMRGVGYVILRESDWERIKATLAAPLEETGAADGPV